MIKELDKFEYCEVHGRGTAVIVLSSIAAVCTAMAASMHVQGSGLSGTTKAVGNPPADINVHAGSEGKINLASGVLTLVGAVCGAVAAGLKASGC